MLTLHLQKELRKERVLLKKGCNIYSHCSASIQGCWVPIDQRSYASIASRTNCTMFDQTSHSYVFFFLFLQLIILYSTNAIIVCLNLSKFDSMTYKSCYL